MSGDVIIERIVHVDSIKDIQIRLSVNEFRGIEYLHLRKYYMSFDEEWCPSNEGISMPLDFNNASELLIGVMEILSLAENKKLLEENLKEVLDSIYEV